MKRAGTVVGDEEDDGVVEFACFFEVGDKAAHFLVDAVDEACVGGHEAGFVAALPGAEFGPFGNVIGAWRLGAVGGQEADLFFVWRRVRRGWLPNRCRSGPGIF